MNDNVVGKRKVKKRTNIPTITLPPPIDKQTYSKQEIINILSPFKHRSPIKVKLMNEILSKKLVRANKSQLNCLLRNHKEGKQIIDNDWNSPGQPRLLKDKDITKISDALEEESGKTIGENELISKNIEAAGLVPICATKNPSRTSVNNYRAVLVSQASVSITTTVILKTNN